MKGCISATDVHARFYPPILKLTLPPSSPWMYANKIADVDLMRHLVVSPGSHLF